MDMETIVSPDIKIAEYPAVVVRHALVDGEQYWLLDFTCAMCSNDGVTYHRSAVRVDSGEQNHEVLDMLLKNISDIIENGMHAEHQRMEVI